GRGRTRRPGAAPPRRSRGEEVLPQAAQGPTVRASGDRHRQAGQLPGRPPRHGGVGEASPVEVPQQSSRELPPTHTSTGADHEVLPLRRPGATLLLSAWRDLLALPSGPAPDVGHGVANRDEPAVHDLERGHRHHHRSLNGTGLRPPPQVLTWPRPTEPRQVDDAVWRPTRPTRTSAGKRLSGRALLDRVRERDRGSHERTSLP